MNTTIFSLNTTLHIFLKKIAHLLKFYSSIITILSVLQHVWAFVLFFIELHLHCNKNNICCLFNVFILSKKFYSSVMKILSVMQHVSVFVLFFIELDLHSNKKNICCILRVLSFLSFFNVSLVVKLLDTHSNQIKFSVYIRYG